MTKSILDPISSVPQLSGDVKVFGFSPNSNCIFTGDSTGAVKIHQIIGFHNDAEKEAILDLIKSSIKLK